MYADSPYNGAVRLMGAVADSAMAAGGQVIGVIPEHLRGREIGHDWRHRAAHRRLDARAQLMMADLSDAFIAL